MMTIQQTIDIPVDRNVHFDIRLPETVRTGRTSVVLIFPTSENPEDERYEPKPFPTIEKLKAEAAAKCAERQAYFKATGKDFFTELVASVKTSPFEGIDGVEYQRKMRDEWPD